MHRKLFFHIFSRKVEQWHITPKIYPSRYDNLGKSFSKYESLIHEYLPPLGPILWRIAPNKSQSVYIPRDNIYDIWHVLAKAFPPECMQYFFKHIFPQNPGKRCSTPKITLRVCYDLGKSYSNYESHLWKFATARPKFIGAVRWRYKNKRKKKRGPWTLTFCFTTAVGMTNGNFLQTCIKNSLQQTKIIETLG